MRVGGGCRFVPAYFLKDTESGEPKLTQAGKDLLDEQHRAQ